MDNTEERQTLAAWLSSDCGDTDHFDNLGHYATGAKMYCIYCMANLYRAAYNGVVPWENDVHCCCICGCEGIGINRVNGFTPYQYDTVNKVSIASVPEYACDDKAKCEKRANGIKGENNGK